MIPQTGNRILSSLQVYVNATSIIVASIGIAVLLGWFFDIASLRSVLPGLATMKANTALCFVFTGSSLWLLQYEWAMPAKKRIGQILAGLVLAISLLTMSQYIFNWELGIDQFLAKDQITHADSFPGRMSQITALCFILSGFSLLLLDSKASQYFSISVLVFSLMALIGYLFDFESLYRLAGYSSIALHTASAFFIVSLGILAARPSRGLMKILTSDQPGSRVMRLLIPTIVVGTLFLEWLVESGESVGLFQAGNKLAVLVVLLIFVYSPLTYFIAKNLNRAEESLLQSEERYRRTLDDMLEGGQIIGFDWRYLYVNAEAVLQSRQTKEKLIGHTMMEVYPGIENTELFSVLQRCMKERESIHMENEFVYPDNSKGWFQLGIQPVPEGLFILSVNITERKQAEEQLQRQLKRLSGLRMVDTAISSSFDLHFILDIVLQQVLSQLGVDASAVLLFNSQLGTINYAASRGFRSDILRSTQYKLNEVYAGRVVRERNIVRISDLMGTSGKSTMASKFASESFVEYLGVPLIVKGEIIGVLEIFHRAPLRVDSEWQEFMERLAGQTAIAINNVQLFNGLQRSNLELGLAYDATIEGWSRAMDLRDKETEGHTLRVTDLTVKLAREMDISELDLIHIRRGALLHDIGKLGVPDHILLKPGDLTDEEWEIMRKHPQFAYDMLSGIHYLRPALDIPYCHHEKWDGTGYPRQLKGEEIPLTARIFAIINVWDALTTDRPYRKAWSKKESAQYIQEQSGKHFDPRVVETFLKMIANI